MNTLVYIPFILRQFKFLDFILLMLYQSVGIWIKAKKYLVCDNIPQKYQMDRSSFFLENICKTLTETEEKNVLATERVRSVRLAKSFYA